MLTLIPGIFIYNYMIVMPPLCLHPLIFSFKVHFNIILLSMPLLCKWSFFFRLPHHNFAFLLSLKCAMCPPQFDHWNYNFWEALSRSSSLCSFLHCLITSKLPWLVVCNSCFWRWDSETVILCRKCEIGNNVFILECHFSSFYISPVLAMEHLL